MALQIVENDPNWEASFDHESPRDRFNRKFKQAESLASILVSEDFSQFNAAIQGNVHWLLSDLLTEAREALRASEKECRS